MKIHIISGFLGSGKTTLINKWLPVLSGEICIVENEFGDVGIDNQLLPKSLNIKKIHSGCICCTLRGDLKEGILNMKKRFNPDHLIIEPSGVASLSEIIEIIKELKSTNIKIGSICTLVDVDVFEDFIKDFGHFYKDQIISAPLVFLSNLKEYNDEFISKIVDQIKGINPKVNILKKEWINLNPEILDIYMSINNSNIENNDLNEIIPADQVLENYSVINPKILTEKKFLSFFNNLERFTNKKLLRSKGIIKIKGNKYIHFDYTPCNKDWNYVNKSSELGVVFIGEELDEKEINKAFNKFNDFSIEKGGEKCN